MQLVARIGVKKDPCGLQVVSASLWDSDGHYDYPTLAGMVGEVYAHKWAIKNAVYELVSYRSDEANIQVKIVLNYIEEFCDRFE